MRPSSSPKRVRSILIRALHGGQTTAPEVRFHNARR